ncbi:hypothetical protein ACJIZ3_010272 [Penstemon smallii]|uniref:Uncharacterized protein n=1 Tax=Penstemon smallii TaxID=265156 RepID=A0ABD3TEU7_9LAMI
MCYRWCHYKGSSVKTCHANLIFFLVSMVF